MVIRLADSGHADRSGTISTPAFLSTTAKEQHISCYESPRVALLSGLPPSSHTTRLLTPANATPYVASGRAQQSFPYPFFPWRSRTIPLSRKNHESRAYIITARTVASFWLIVIPASFAQLVLTLHLQETTASSAQNSLWFELGCLSRIRFSKFPRLCCRRKLVANNTRSDSRL